MLSKAREHDKTVPTISDLMNVGIPDPGGSAPAQPTYTAATGTNSLIKQQTLASALAAAGMMPPVAASPSEPAEPVPFRGSIPIPEVIRNINSFTLGAQSVNPKIKTKVVWVNKWFDPPKEGEGAGSLISGGADVLFQNTDSSAVLQTAEKMGKRAFGWDSDMTAYGPKAHLGSAVINWAPYYIKATKDALEGTWSTGGVWWGVKEGAIDIVSISDAVPADTKAKIEIQRAIGKMEQLKGELEVGRNSMASPQQIINRAKQQAKGRVVRFDLVLRHLEKEGGDIKHQHLHHHES